MPKLAYNHVETDKEDRIWIFVEREKKTNLLQQKLTVYIEKS